MKHVIFTFGLFLFAIAMSGQPGGVTFGPHLSVNEDLHDFGTIEKGGNGTCVFIVTNTGTEPLIISKCDKTCGCTIPECSKNPIMPGAQSEITVKYDTQRVGPFQKAVKVYSNCAENPVMELRIKGKVIEASSGDPTP
jgi:hypothetical protein